jgi:hypothetical protein
MNMLRGLLLDNLGLKLVALLLAVLVYLNVFTERSATMLVEFPIHFTDLADSLSLSGPMPPAIQAELRGTGKNFIRLWLTEPRIKISLAGMGPGRHRRLVESEDLPLISSDKLKVERLVTDPPQIEWIIEVRASRLVPVAPRLEGDPARGFVTASIRVEPPAFRVRGPEKVLVGLDSVRLEPVRIAGRRDTVRAAAGPDSLPEGCTVDPAEATVTVTLERGRS